MNRQRGIAIVTGLYIFAGLAALGIGYGVVHTYNSAIEERDKAKASYADCKLKYEALLGRVNTQNIAIEGLAKERDDANARADKALAIAAANSAARAPELRRLVELAKAAKGQGACPAGDAVKEVRRGLKP